MGMLRLALLTSLWVAFFAGPWSQSGFFWVAFNPRLGLLSCCPGPGRLLSAVGFSLLLHRAQFEARWGQVRNRGRNVPESRQKTHGSVFGLLARGSNAMVDAGESKSSVDRLAVVVCAALCLRCELRSRRKWHASCLLGFPGLHPSDAPCLVLTYSGHSLWAA